MQEVRCPGCGRRIRYDINVDVAVRSQRRTDDNFVLCLVGMADVARSTVRVEFEDVERGERFTEPLLPVLVRSVDGGGRVEDPSVRDQHLTVIDQCIDQADVLE